MDKNKVIDLNYLSVLEITGKGAPDLLQGQITCDVNKVNLHNSCLGALCNAKGRIISSFILYLIKEESYGLIGPSKTLIKTETELNKYSPFYQAELKHNKSLSFYGVEKNTFEDFYKKKIGVDVNTVQINSDKFISYLNKKFILAVIDETDSSVFNNQFEHYKDSNEWHLDEIL
ncbi:MAG TPA: hypothetical protein EYO81_00465, partial [Gammaproteobacteria bacterium]|nr:hypothetical protein [Gammaproteobacteria bacterium]